MTRVFVAFLVVAVNFIMQSTVFQYIAINGVKPNTAIIIIVSYAILRGDIEGAILGFFAGLLQDMFFGYYIGLYVFLGAMTGFVCGKPFKDFFPENYLLPIILVLFSVLSYEFIFYIVSFLIYGKIEFSYYFKSIILPETIYTTAISLIFYRIVYGINRRLEKHEKKNQGFFGNV